MSAEPAWFATTLDVRTAGRGTVDITAEVEQAVAESGVTIGLCHVFVRHTSASLIVCENADPDVRRDLETWMAGAVQDGDPRFLHTAEGADDMPAHVRSVLTQTELTLPIRAGGCGFGTWQGLYLWEHRAAAHRRQVLITVQGER